MKQIIVLILLISLGSSTLVIAGEDEEMKKYEDRSARADQWVFSDLPRHIGNDFKESFFNGWSLLGLAGGSIIIAGVHTQDTSIQNTFQTKRPFGKKFDDIMNIGANPFLLTGGSLLTLGIAELLDSPAAKKTAVTAGIFFESLMVTETVALGLQLSTRRARPDGSGNSSFPSGHTTGVFTAASVAATLYGPWVGVPSFALASLVGLSRIDANKHFASDVLAGALLGTIMGSGVARFHKKEFSSIFLVPTMKADSMGIEIVHPF